IEIPEIPQAISLEKKEIHVVAKGQTLSTIARLYGTSVSDLKKLNQLKSDKVNLGQELRVPVQKPEAEIAKPEPKKEIREEIEKPMVAEVKPKPSPEIVKEKAQEILKNEPVAENPIPEKEEIKMTNGIREVNNALGYTRVVETGFAEAIEGEGNSKKHLCLHKTAPIGSILQVKNETNGQSVFVKVIGKLPETGSNEKLVIRISRQAYDRLLAVGKRFPVEVSYPQAQP
ncbi:MAG TPA: LysM peptidoglycan-binding domain-containing protein, partial [Catalimonadaceae bacterium]|nr:LysM peptidoglycan-binding domain-containing protein [Catalimonadaceae bacterium]